MKSCQMDVLRVNAVTVVRWLGVVCMVIRTLVANVLKWISRARARLNDVVCVAKQLVSVIAHSIARCASVFVCCEICS
jgi:hypothetical protein